MNTRRRWSHEELVRALSLYCQIPFGKMHAKNPAVIALADSIGRTPSAVALKLVNFASLDPELRARGIGGMANTSADDRRVWDEFFGRWELLAEYAMEPEPPLDAPEPTAVLREVKVRRGQAFFRAAVLAAHEGRCCLTGISSPHLLRASHIVPWAKDEGLRLNPRNGLCLNALHDAAFDRGLITFSPRLELMVSGRVRDDVPTDVYVPMFEKLDQAPLRLPERFVPDESALEYHRRHVFVW